MAARLPDRARAGPDAPGPADVLRGSHGELPPRSVRDRGAGALRPAARSLRASERGRRSGRGRGGAQALHGAPPAVPAAAAGHVEPVRVRGRTRMDATVAVALGAAAAVAYALSFHPDWIYDPLRSAELTPRGPGGE